MLLLMFTRCKQNNRYLLGDSNDSIWLSEVSVPLIPDLDSVLSALVDEADPDGFTSENPIYYVVIRDTYDSHTISNSYDYNIKVRWFSNECFKHGCHLGYLNRDGKTFILNYATFPVRCSGPETQHIFYSKPISSPDNRITFLIWDYDFSNGLFKKKAKHILKRVNKQENNEYCDSVDAALEAVLDTLTAVCDG